MVTICLPHHFYRPPSKAAFFYAPGSLPPVKKIPEIAKKTCGNQGDKGHNKNIAGQNVSIDSNTQSYLYHMKQEPDLRLRHKNGRPKHGSFHPCQSICYTGLTEAPCDAIIELSKTICFFDRSIYGKDVKQCLDCIQGSLIPSKSAS